MVAILGHQVGHDLQGLAGIGGALEGDIYERAVVHDAGGVLELMTSAPCALGDGQAVLVHVAYGSVGALGLGYLAEILACVPFIYLAHLPGGMSGTGSVIEFAIKSVAVSGISHKHRAVDGSVFSGNETGTRKTDGGHHKGKPEH